MLLENNKGQCLIYFLHLVVCCAYRQQVHLFIFLLVCSHRVPAQLAGHWERGQLLLLSTCGLVCYMPVKWFAEFITLYEILLVLLHGKHIIFLELVIIY